MHTMLAINNSVQIPYREIEIKAIRSSGPGGQNVNKVASAIHLRFNIHRSSLSGWHKTRLLALNDQRLGLDGAITIKSQSYRTQAQNKAEAFARLTALLRSAFVVQTKRRATRPTKGSVRRRLDGKSRRSTIKSTRGKVSRGDD